MKAAAEESCLSSGMGAIIKIARDKQRSNRERAWAFARILMDPWIGKPPSRGLTEWLMMKFTRAGLCVDDVLDLVRIVENKTWIWLPRLEKLEGESISPEGVLLKWIKRVMQSELNNFWRDSWRTGTLSIDKDCPTSPDNVAILDDDMDHQKTIDRILAILAPEDRSVFVMYYIEGFRVSEIAKVSGTTEAAVKMRLSRIRRFLRKHLQPHLDSA